MIFKGFIAWILVCCQVSCRPLSSALDKEDETVTRCIVEVISDTLSKPHPLPLSGDCSRILREDERILAMVRHQNLLKELEDLTHREVTKESLPKKSNKRWNYAPEESVELNEEDNVKKQHMLNTKNDASHRGRANAKNDVPLKRKEDMEKYVESEEENLKGQHDDKVMTGEDDTKKVMPENEEELSDEDKRSPEKRHRVSSEEDRLSNELEQEDLDALSLDEMVKKIARKEEEDRLSNEYEQEDLDALPLDEMVKKIARKEEEDRLSNEHEQEDLDALSLDEMVKKIAREELEDEEDKRADEKKQHSSEEDDFKKGNEGAQSNVKKRVEENASDEETDQFEVDENGVKTQQHQADDKHSHEKMSQEDKRHHFLEEDMDLNRHDNDREYPEKRHHGIENGEERDEEEEEEIDEDEEEEEEEERKQKYEEHKLKNLVGIEEELKKVAEKLRDIRRG
ncbi:chromogranin-A-like isoform X4 [Scyliorhinus canicula]|uniref:chromogranin-A-like isoform X4 n=1 Tax=Scyliorhinus canicula TaxID=7830 RepID=UPI0018F660FD|nr:chromogranin-A-like isoform X4 [Scyliorhinus canicula]